MYFISRTIFLIVITVTVSGKVLAQKSWQEIITVEDLYISYSETLEEMLNQLILDYPGLEKVKAAKEKGKMVDASKYLLEYYQSNNRAEEYRRTQPSVSDKTIAEADTILKNVFIVQNVRGQVPYGDDGHRDWYYKGPNNDREWAWLSNRHSQIVSVLDTYFETGNPKYAEYIDMFLRDFIIKSMPYPAEKSSTSVWRGLEVAARAKVWTRIFYSMINSDYLSPATKLLILSSLPDHAHYNRNFHGGNNWLTMEISALATVAAYFPEYQKSDEWMDYAIAQMTASMKDQVYPDGVQTELTSHYHNVSLRNFELFQDICQKADKQLPQFFNQTIEAMYSYIAHAVRPSGFRILNNDGDRGSDREIILSGAETYNHPEWEYIITNGKSGKAPTDGPSYFFPWAGQLISRSGYDADAHWSFFDIGPWGSGHQHNDKLHISISAYGRDLLVDAGRFAYTGEVAEKFRSYARGSEGHNIILIDDEGQEGGPTHAQKPLSDRYYKISEDFDYASGSFDEFEDTEEVKHSRAILYVRGEFWVVVDKINTNKPRKVDALWHWHPESIPIQEDSIVKTENTRGNLAVIPISGHKFDINFVKGQEQPEIQGWYSPEYNLYEPNITSFYTTNIKESSTLVWLLLPTENELPNYKASVISEEDNVVNVEVQIEEHKWQLSIPFENSVGAKLVME
ncbi:alginate lyase family protein [Catalinimonas sp. 4WD22]|uniref:alginate lyase family protein n=1 Tax=Catalinimonas locisalis TaxID=3133978 RepID=UPI003100E808